MSSSSSELEASGTEDEGGDTDIQSSSSSDKDESYENDVFQICHCKGPNGSSQLCFLQSNMVMYQSNS